MEIYSEAMPNTSGLLVSCWYTIALYTHRHEFDFIDLSQRGWKMTGLWIKGLRILRTGQLGPMALSFAVRRGAPATSAW